MRSDAELMMDLFAGSDIAHGRSEMTATVSLKGKHEAKSWTVKSAAGLKEWEAHLAGTAGLGIPFLNSKNEVKMGAIDVDVYNGLSIESLNAKIQEAKLPLVIFRSKSGGPHIFMFLQEWVPASEMIEKMDSIAGFLGFGTSEIFPKQAMIAQNTANPDFGSWINMPYFGGTRYLRYALDQDGKAITSIAALGAYAEARRLSAAGFRALVTPEPPALFPDGPPCLNAIFATHPTDNRNILLANAAVYAKKAFPEAWKARLDTYNAAFGEPLGSAEVEALKKSYDRKDYRYQCSKQPLCNFCDSSRCRKTQHGVGGGDFLPATRSLSMVNTTPAIWYLDLTLPDNRAIRISLSTEELQNPKLFQRRCMETIQQMPPTMKAEEWQTVVQGLMQHCTKIELHEALTPKGHMLELMFEWLKSRAEAGGREALLTHQPYKDATHYYFRFTDLKRHLKAQGFAELTTGQITAILQNDLKCLATRTTINGTFLEFLSVPVPKDHGPETPLPAPTFETAY